MFKKKLALCTLLLFFNFIFGCATGTTSVGSNITTTSTSEFIAKKLPELELTTTDGKSQRGKILNLIGKEVLFSPLPYWNVETLKIHLDNIQIIKLAKKGGKAGMSFIHGFGWIFIITGALGAIFSEYDEDFSGALAGSAVAGLIGGLIGLAIGGITKAATKSEYKFYIMSDTEKTKAILKIMGY